MPQARRESEAYLRAAADACDARRNVIQLIYRDKSFEGSAKDFRFEPLTMREHWHSGFEDIRGKLLHPEWAEHADARGTVRYA